MNMRNSILSGILLLTLLPTSLFATRQRTSGWCEQGGIAVTVPGTAGSGSQRFQQSFRTCTVTVYLQGTTTLATLYSADTGTARANPFTSDSTGYWFFYADGGRYDVRFSNGGIGAPFTLGDFRVPSETFNVLDFGAKCDGTTNDYTAMNNARAAATALTNGGTVIVPPGTGSCRISQSLTFNANVAVYFVGGGRFTIDTGVTVAFSGAVVGDPGLRLFEGAGTASVATTVSNQSFYPQWWGVVTNSVSAAGTNTTILNTLMATANRKWHFICGDYYINARITVVDGVQWHGNGRCSNLKADGVAQFNNAMVFLNTVNNVEITDMRFDGSRDLKVDGAMYGIETRAGGQHKFHNLWFEQIPSETSNLAPASQTYGDGMILGNASPTGNNIEISNVFMNRVTRNGISVSHQTDLVISNLDVQNVLSTKPGCAVDVEPDGSAASVTLNIAVNNLTVTSAECAISFSGELTNGYKIKGASVSNLTARSITGIPVVVLGAQDVSIHGCSLENTNSTSTTNGAIRIYRGTGDPTPVPRGISVTGCTIVDSLGDGIEVQAGNSVSIAGNAIIGSARDGLRITSNTVAPGGEIYGLTVSGNAIINSGNARQAIFISDARPIVGLNISGNTLSDIRTPAVQSYAINVSSTGSQASWLLNNNTMTPVLTAVTNGFFNTGFYFSADTTSTPTSIMTVNDLRAGATTENAVLFQRQGVTVGSITVTNAATAYNTTSDERLKINISDLLNALPLLDRIRAREFDWKSGGHGVGFVAQELYSVYPQAVYKPSDSAEMWAVDYSKLVPLLVRAVQELAAEVRTLQKK